MCVWCWPVQYLCKRSAFQPLVLFYTVLPYGATRQ